MEKPEKISAYGRTVHNFDPKIFPERSYFIASASCVWSSGKKKAFDMGGPSLIDFIYF